LPPRYSRAVLEAPKANQLPVLSSMWHIKAVKL